MAHPHSECCSAWKEGDSDTGCGVEERWAPYAQGRKPDTKELAMSEPTHTRPRAGGTIDTESRMVGARGWGRGKRTERLMGTVLVLQESSGSRDSGHGCTPVWWTLKCALQQALRWQMLCVCNHKFLKLKKQKKVHERNKMHNFPNNWEIETIGISYAHTCQPGRQENHSHTSAWRTGKSLSDTSMQTGKSQSYTSLADRKITVSDASLADRKITVSDASLADRKITVRC